MPIFGFNTDTGFFYGFPPYRGQIKIARHTGGDEIKTPTELGLKSSAEEINAITIFSKKNLNGIELKPNNIKHCLYTKTLDSNFIIDRHPKFDNVVFAVGFSGHGYKFTPAIGIALTNLIIGEKNDHIKNFRIQ